MRRLLVLLIVLLLLAALEIPSLPARALGYGLADDVTPWPQHLYLPQIEQAPTPSPPLTDTPTATPTATETSTPTLTPTITFTPSPSSTPSPTPTVSPVPLLPDRLWDPRLDLRGACLILADVAPGQGYWRLVRGNWYAENEWPFAGQHHIFVDALTPQGLRQTGLLVRVTSLDGGAVYGTVYTEQKPGDLYAANFPMWTVAPAYRAVPADGHPADAVSRLGMGSIELPAYTIHTSYGFVWQWMVAPPGGESDNRHTCSAWPAHPAWHLWPARPVHATSSW